MKKWHNLAGKRLGKYKVLKSLGHSEKGIVYQVSDVALDRILSLKILSPRYGNLEKLVGRFKKQVNAINSLNHPGIAHMYDIEKQDNIYFIVQEYFKGETLTHLLEEKTFSVEESLQIAISITESLNAAHKASIVHHTVEPSCILISNDGQVKITDFAMNVFHDNLQQNAPKDLLEFYYYSPPEFMHGQSPDHRADMYSIGTVLFHMLAGQHPFIADNPSARIKKQLAAPTPHLQDIRPEMSKNLAEIIKRLMAKKPDERFAELRVVLKAFRACARKLNTHQKNDENSKPADKRIAGPVPSGKLRKLLLQEKTNKAATSGSANNFSEDQEKTIAFKSNRERRREMTQTFKDKPVLCPVLVVIEGVNLGEPHLLTKDVTIFGRSSKCDIPVKDKNMSRTHCKIILERETANQEECRVYLEDLNSSNGTELNRKKISGRSLIRNGDIISFGNHTFGFYLKFKKEIDIEMHLYKMATRDKTTGLLNKSIFDSTIEFEFKRSKSYQIPLVFVMMDIDHFKKINDTYGHATGDKVLNEIGQLLSAKLRDHDTSIRYGGEEFAIFLPETDKENSIQVVERLRREIENHVFQGTKGTFQVTASFGLVCCEDAQAPEELMTKADQALYQAKENGRNQLVFAGR